MAVTISRCRPRSWPIRFEPALKSTSSVIAIKRWSSRAIPTKSPRLRAC